MSKIALTTTIGMSRSMAVAEKLPASVFKALQILTKPHDSITDPLKRRQARLLSIFSLIAMPIFAFAQTITYLVPQTELVYLVGSVMVFFAYILSRSKYFDIGVVYSVVSLTALPPLVFFFGTNWQHADLPHLTVWVFVALLIGSLMLRPVHVLLQFVSSILLLVAIGVGYHGLPINVIGEHLGTTTIVSVLIIIGAVMLQDYMHQVQARNIELDRKTWELEVYSQLLRHDLRNDLQAMLNAVELSDMILEANPEFSHEHNRRLSMTSLRSCGAWVWICGYGPQCRELSRSPKVD